MSAGSLRRLCAIVLLAGGISSTAQSARPRTGNVCAGYAVEAASRARLSVDIVLRVMMAESGGNARIVSPKGAMGCMQIMPATWTYLSARYNLGADPFDPRRNMIGGAMYLAELSARYGLAGAIAAYNAGPGRYERYASGSKALPAETIAYVQRIGASARSPAAGPVAVPARWQEAGLFLVRGPSQKATPTVANEVSTTGRPVTVDPLFPLGGIAEARAAGATGP